MVASKQWRGLRAERYKDEGVKRVQNIALITSCSADNLLRALPPTPLTPPCPQLLLNTACVIITNLLRKLCMLLHVYTLLLLSAESVLSTEIH